MKQSIIEQIAAEQQTYLLAENTGLERTSLSSLPDLQNYALIISGIRRCGKSTLLKQFLASKYKSAFFFNFEDIRLYEFSIDDFRALDTIINNSGKKVLFFDEIQIIKAWELYVRQKLDQGFQVALTGSNAEMLSRELGTKLTGRHITKELYPFSFSEFAAFKQQEKSEVLFSEYLNTGGFPEVVKTENKEILPFLIEDIINRDIAVRYGIKDVSTLKRLCSFFMNNVGNMVSPSKLTTAIGVKAPSTVLEYFSYFENCYLINLLPKFAYSAKAQMLAPKKLYMNDTGLINAGTTAFSKNSGHILENAVFYHLRRKQNELYYFNENSAECDFIIKEKEQVTQVIQVCWQLDGDNEEREINGLFAAMDYFKLDEGTIVTFNDSDLLTKSRKTIQIVPAWKWCINPQGSKKV
jgi:predicted AAA+ superfamily ATPase